jgi:hypothetical protein
MVFSPLFHIPTIAIAYYVAIPIFVLCALKARTMHKTGYASNAMQQMHNRATESCNK